MAGKARHFFTENFAANLDEIQSVLSVEGQSVFQRLLKRLSVPLPVVWPFILGALRGFGGSEETV